VNDETIICPICGTEGAETPDVLNFPFLCKCVRCGIYRVGYKEELEGLTDKQKAVVSYHVRKNQNISNSPYLFNKSKNPNAKIDSINSWNIEIVKDFDLPKVSEQLNNLIEFIGDNTDGLGGKLLINNIEAAATIGTLLNPQNLYDIVKWLENKKYIPQTSIDLSNRCYPLSLCLTFEGWQKYDELKKTSLQNSMKAFMAMKFSEDNIEQMLSEHFQPALQKAFGIDLQKLTDNEKAGNIDARLLNEIRSSRFMIADVTHKNNGVYWEAGFAEAIETPVIYTCEKSAFNDENNRPHFDIGHYNTIAWDLKKPEEAVAKLVNIVRNTFPDLDYKENCK
jgi:nucleoside 2-deoxyribosyltransferase